MMIERAMREQEPTDCRDAVTAPAAENRGMSEARLRQMLTGDLATIVQSACILVPGTAIRQWTRSRWTFSAISAAGRCLRGRRPRFIA